MFFFPYRVDLALGKIPIVTIIICMLCIFTYIRQIQNTHSIEASTEHYCTSAADPNLERVIRNLGIAQIRSCQDMIFYLHSIRDPEQQIRYMVQESSLYKRNPLIGYELSRYLQSEYEKIQMQQALVQSQLQQSQPPAQQQWTCSGNQYNRSDFSTCSQVMSYFNACPGDPSRLDGDHDGRPCEKLCK